MSDIVTTTGQPIGDYPDYKQDKTAAEIAEFETTARIPLAGKYNAASETMETKTVALSELGGLPPTAGKQGQVLTVNNSEEAVWGAPAFNPPADFDPFKGLIGKSVGDKLEIAPTWTAVVDAVESGVVTAFHVEGAWGTIATGGGGS